MAIVGVRSEVVVGYSHSRKTGLLTFMNNGTVSGESNKLTSGTATSILGKALNFVGNSAAARAIPVATLTRQKPA